MQRLISILVLLFLFNLAPVVALAGWFSGDTLVTVDGTDYTKDDFKRWWDFWKEKDQQLPETPDFYIDWLLLKDEAARMEIADTPSFKRQERIFLQSRGLLMLKNEAVDSQINVTEELIRERYQRDYQPRWLLQQMTFADEETAMSAWQELRDGTLTVAQLLERSEEEKGPVGHGERWMRPGTDAGWEDLLRQTAVGKVMSPELHNKGENLYYLKATDSGSEKDFASLQAKISKKLWREQEDALTDKLLDELSDRYQVKIDEERLAAIDVFADSGALSDEPVITSSKENVSEKQFVEVVRRLMDTRAAVVKSMKDEEGVQNLKERTARNIIHQSVTNWWTLDRHYEKEEPFKKLYQFNYNYRLVTMLEDQLFKVKVDPSGEELAQLYQEKAQYYVVPSQAKLYILNETYGPIRKIWADVAVGKSFKQVMGDHLERPVMPTELPLNHLDPQVREVVEKLADGETSQIFKAQGSQVLVHLVSRTPEQTLPLEKIKDSLISGYKRERYDQAREAYIKTLRLNTRIELEEDNWQDIKKELGGA